MVIFVISSSCDAVFISKVDWIRNMKYLCSYVDKPSHVSHHVFIPEMCRGIESCTESFEMIGSLKEKMDKARLDLVHRCLETFRTLTCNMYPLDPSLRRNTSKKYQV